jgi:hypothetical protein
MPATNEHKRLRPSGKARTTSANPYRSAASRHDDAVIQAEVRDLASALRPFGALSGHALESAAEAAKWHEGGFRRALSAAVKAGTIEQLPGDFYRDSHSA